MGMGRQEIGNTQIRKKSVVCVHACTRAHLNVLLVHECQKIQGKKFKKTSSWKQ